MRTLILFLLGFSLISCSEAPDLSPSKMQPVLLKRNYNDIFSYEILPAMGTGTLKQQGNTKDLLKNIPYLLSSGIIPPEFVVNEILSKGKVDAGMSGGATWEQDARGPRGGRSNWFDDGLSCAWRRGGLY